MWGTQGGTKICGRSVEKIMMRADWRGETFAFLRQHIHDADPGVVFADPVSGTFGGSGGAQA